MTLEEFMTSAKGRKLEPLLQDPKVVDRMVAISRLGRPAVKAIDDEVANRVGSLDNVEKQHVGRWVRNLLGQRGLKPSRQLDWRGGKVFSSGNVYQPIARPAPTSAATGSDMIAQARALLLAGRIDAERPLDSVDDFLADRRQLWREA
jgi:hypothetical protein